MEKRRILLLTNRVPYPLTDGGSIAMHAMMEGYFRAGWEVMLYSMNTSRHYVPVESLPALYRSISFETFDIDTDVRLLPTVKNFFLSRQPNHAERFFNKDFQKKLTDIIQDFEPELIQLESVFLSTYIPAIRAASSVKIILRLHNIEHHIWEQLAAETTNRLRRYYLRDLASRIRKLETASWKMADILMPITEDDAAVVRSFGIDTVQIVVPPGIVTSVTPVSGTSGAWVGYHIGAMDWVPNAEAITWFLEDVWPVIYRQVPGFAFHFAGRGMPASFKKYEKDGVCCAGEVEDAEQFIAGKNILIVPLRSGSGIRIKVMEAMVAGKLVISTQAGMHGISEAVPLEHYLPADSPEEFADRIIWTLGNKEAAAGIAANGRKMVLKHYHIDRIMDALLARIG